MNLNSLDYLHSHHLRNCTHYRKIVESLFSNEINPSNIYLHASLFKTHRMRSINEETNYNYQSSGTSGNISQIKFNRIDAINQQKYLVETIKNFIKINKSLLFIDLTTSYSEEQNARNAASRGFSLLSKKRIKLPPNLKDAFEFLKKNVYQYEQIIIFGFTFELYLLIKGFIDCNYKKLDCPEIIFIHGGGWKKLENLKVDNSKLNLMLTEIFTNFKTINYYGMIEQLGLVYPMCEYGYHHCPQGSDIIIRDRFGQRCRKDEIGLIQSISPLPTSYPGHSILTDDLGSIYSNHICKCGRDSKSFKILGRLETLISRGCSDAY